jgi:HAD superfamily hydrolase (TIGR01458 family)
MTVRGFLLDIEGTIVGDKRYEAIGGAVEFIRRVRDAAVPLRLISNNTTDSRPALVDKLARAGFDFTIDEIHTCIGAAATHLRTAGARTCLVLGTSELERMFSAEGFVVREDSEVDAVIVGLHTALTFADLVLACEAVSRHGAALIALHRNRIFEDARGRRCPSVGAIVEAIRYATQVEPVLIGKPSPTYFRQALDDMAVAAASVMVVSDDPYSDLAGAKHLGMQAAFVLSGKYRDPAVIETIPEDQRPDVTVKAIGDLVAHLPTRA